MTTSASLGRFDPAPAEQRVVLHNVSWSAYEQLVAEFAGQSSPRIAYEEGTLEIMTPLGEHERIKHAIEMLLEYLAEELDSNLYCLGSTTFRRKDLQRGFEPDSCFYIQNEAKVRGKESIDLAMDPPPDLLVEIDISRNSMNKFGIYASMGAPEVWRHDGSRLFIYTLTCGEYTEVSNSLAYPFLTSKQLSDVLAQVCDDLPSRKFRKALRQWAGEIGEQAKDLS